MRTQFTTTHMLLVMTLVAVVAAVYSASNAADIIALAGEIFVILSLAFFGCIFLVRTRSPVTRSSIATALLTVVVLGSTLTTASYNRLFNPWSSFLDDIFVISLFMICLCSGLVTYRLFWTQPHEEESD